MKIKLTILMLFLLFPLSAHTGYAADTLFVFNPEAKVSKITKVKTELENYLKSQGIDANVYIFATPEDFDNSAKRLQPAGAIVASYYYTMMKSKYLWNAVLSGHKDGAKFYNKILVALKSVTAPSQLVNKSLAAVSLGSSSAYIDALLPSGLSAETVRIVSVSKDVDAIMALGFEQVQAAIVIKENFEKLEKINPDVVKNLHILQEMNPIPYPKFVVFPKASQTDLFIKALKNIPYKEPTKEVLKFFDITGFDAE